MWRRRREVKEPPRFSHVRWPHSASDRRTRRWTSSDSHREAGRSIASPREAVKNPLKDKDLALNKLTFFAGVAAAAVTFHAEVAGAVEEASWAQVKAQATQIGEEPQAAGKTAAVKAWNQLTRSEKEQLVLDAAFRYKDRAMGQCKEFVRTAITEAAKGAGGNVFVPSNLPGGTGWDYSSDFVGYNQCIPIENVRRGQIIQMRLRFKDGTEGPHTCFVSARFGDTMGWIDSNWSEDRDEKVRVHYESISAFKKKVVAYSIYTLQ